MLRILTSGESHGKCLIVIIEGYPAGIKIDRNFIDNELRRRQIGFGRSERMHTIEKDEVEILSGVRYGKSLGSPITLKIENKDYKNWKDIMSTNNEQRITNNELTIPRPGHADLPGLIKYHFSDIRNVLERASARETVARCAAGALCKVFLNEFNIKIFSWVIQIGKIKLRTMHHALHTTHLFEKLFDAAEKSEVRCPNKNVTKEMIELIRYTEKKGDTLGGIFEVVAINVPPGLGSYTHYDKRLDARLASALMSIPAIKGVEIGLGFKQAELFGSQVHDEIYYEQRTTKNELRFYRKTNNAGGLEGGVTNGQPIILRCCMKPISTLKKPLKSVDIKTKKQVKSFKERADICAVPSAAVVAEGMVAIELVKTFQEKFGSDSIEEINNNYKQYIEYIKSL